MRIPIRTREELQPSRFVPTIYEHSKLVRVERELVETFSLGPETSAFLTRIGMPPGWTGLSARMEEAKPIREMFPSSCRIRSGFDSCIYIGKLTHAKLGLMPDGRIFFFIASQADNPEIFVTYVSVSPEAYAAQIALRADLERYFRPAGSYNRNFECRPFTGELLGASSQEIEAVFRKELCLIDPDALASETNYWSGVINEYRCFGFGP